MLQNRVTKASSSSSSPGYGGGGGFERETRCKNRGRSWRKRETEGSEESEGVNLSVKRGEKEQRVGKTGKGREEKEMEERRGRIG